MKPDYNKKNLTVIILAITAAALLSYFVIRPQLQVIGSKKIIIQNHKAKLSQWEESENLRSRTDDETGRILGEIGMLQEAYFVPFLQENIVLGIGGLMMQNGIKPTSMSFQEPESITLDFPGITESRSSADIFDQVLERIQGKNQDGISMEDEKLLEARQYMKDALELYDSNSNHDAAINPEDIDYTVERTNLMITFQAENYKNIITLLGSMQKKSPGFIIYALNITKNQTGWSGDMVLHFYMLPDFR